MPPMRLQFSLIFIGMLLLLSACASSDAAAPVPGGSNTSQGETAPVVLNPAESGPAPSTSEAVEREADYCLQCHTSQQQLMDTAQAQPPFINRDLGLAGEVSEKEPWEKVLVASSFPDSIHGLYTCIVCHGGVNSPDKDAAHQGVAQNPSRDPARICGECHPNIVAHQKNNLHSNLVGYRTALNKRSMPADHPALQKALEANCASCHATCGECHVSRPAVVGGGFVEGHIFFRTPSMTENCTACHGARVGNEYLGLNEGLPADVHYQQGGMTCTACHDGHNLHGETANCQTCHPGPKGGEVPPPKNRYEGVQSPRCESCHAKVSAGADDIIMHQMHGAKLSCQVCHSVSYSNCEGCHTGSNQPGGQAEYTLQNHYFDFLIGRNPLPSYERPYEYVPVRHTPVLPDTFQAYGTDLFKLFDQAETWKYTTPHNIQRRTPQAASCNACHGNPEWFLTADKLSPEELKANQPVIVDSPPPVINSASQLP
jgi:hypothetical protein